MNVFVLYLLTVKKEIKKNWKWKWNEKPPLGKLTQTLADL